MDNKILIGIIIVGILLVGGYLYYNTGAEVSAQGMSVLTVQPDEASIYLNVEARDQSAQKAKDEQAAINDKVMSALTNLGIEEKDIQTMNYNIYQEYDWNTGRQTPKGYVATQQVIVKSKDFKKVPSIVDASVDNGAVVSGINFELSQEKQNDYKAEALSAASEDAKKKAEATAAGLGKSLGRLVSVESQDFNYEPWIYYAKGEVAVASEARDAAVKITPQEQEIRATVNVRYKLGIF